MWTTRQLYDCSFVKVLCLPTVGPLIFVCLGRKKGEIIACTFHFTPSPPSLSPALTEELGQKPPLGIITALIMCYHSQNGTEFEAIHLKASESDKRCSYLLSDVVTVCVTCSPASQRRQINTFPLIPAGT